MCPCRAHRSGYGGPFTGVTSDPGTVRLRAARTVDEAVTALGENDNAKLLAGGQSLLPILRLRLAYPDLVVDLSRTAGMWGIRDDGDALVIGGMTTHYEMMTSDLVQRHCGFSARPPRRSRIPRFGTAAPSAGRSRTRILPATCPPWRSRSAPPGGGGDRRAARDTRVRVLRRLPAAALQPIEVLVEVRVPKLGTGSGWGYRYEKFQRVAQAWAIVGVAALVRRSGDVIEEARVGLTNMGSTPLRASATDAALAGAAATAGAVAEAAELAAEGTSPTSDLSGQADYRQHLARVLTQDAVASAAGI